MPRRPRPSSRAPPRPKQRPAPQLKPEPQTSKWSAPPPKSTHAHFSDRDEEEESDGDDSDLDEEGDHLEPTSDDEGDATEHDAFSEEGSDDADAPRLAQWVDPDELVDSDGGDHDSDEPSAPRTTVASLHDDLSALPLGALRKAQVALSRAEVESASNSEDEDESQSDGGDDAPGAASTSKSAPKEWDARPRKDLAKRANKHAPIEMSSKRPVSRRRTVVDVPKLQPRDPRFLQLAGELSPRHFREDYRFLTEMHAAERTELRESLKRARKLLTSSPRHLWEEREAEVQRLEQALKRAESAVNKDRREEVEQNALQNAAKEEKERRKQGKGVWYMKQGEKKDMLLKARYDALAATGGQGAVKKAIEKKQKKISQKEKKSRPFKSERPSQFVATGANSVKRGRDAGYGERPPKRART